MNSHQLASNSMYVLIIVCLGECGKDFPPVNNGVGHPDESELNHGDVEVIFVLSDLVDDG